MFIISAGITRAVTEEDKEWVRASLSQLGRFTGMGWILSPEAPQVIPVAKHPNYTTLYNWKFQLPIVEMGRKECLIPQ